MDDATLLRRSFQAHLGLLLRSITAAIAGLSPGPRRLMVAVEAYWEVCHRHRDSRSQMIAAARRSDSAAELVRLAGILERMLASELRHCGSRAPDALAATLSAEIRAVARAELGAAARLPEQRRRLFSLIEQRLDDGAQTPASPAPRCSEDGDQAAAA